MSTLDDYLTGDFHTDQRDLAAVEDLLQDVLPTLAYTHVSGEGWAYEVRRDVPLTPPPKFSFSTTAMVLLAIEKALGNWGPKQQDAVLPQYPSVRLKKEIKQKLTPVAIKGFHELAMKVTEGEPSKTGSSSYGDNDPLTLSYLADLCRICHESSELFAKLSSYVRGRAVALAQITPETGLKSDGGYFPGLKDLTPRRSPVMNSFIPLRVVRAIRACDLAPPNCRGFFETALHQQLSFSSIPDSRFDPAELAFCLEGLLLSSHSEADSPVDLSTFRRALEVLRKAQEESAYWRPTKPFLATEQGMVMFPLSIEAVNSLLRGCELFDGRDLFDTIASANVSLFRRYWRWLQARTVRFEHGGARLVGWHSEHVNELDVIHVWDTSQVVEFLLNYRRLLQAHIGRTTMIASRLTRRLPEDVSDKPWGEIRTKFEPVTVLGPRYKVYARLNRDFYEGWKQREARRSYSVLLYGPPGTGKTTIAKNLANALEFPLITVTVSDFLGQGGAQVEARAKAIFQVLESQTDCIVLFDEIDNFLLDRDSDRYAKQDSVFQFMTPGMLTKLNDLREKERIIFLVATNYENRIDSAIKRPGRIDQRYLVLPPDAGARWGMIELALTERKVAYPELESASEELKKVSVFLSYKDIDACVVEAGQSDDKSIGRLVKAFDDRGRTTIPEDYLSRFPTGGDGSSDSVPLEEFLGLVALAAEVESDKFLRGKVYPRVAAYLSREHQGRDFVEIVTDTIGPAPNVLVQRVAEALRTPSS